MPPSGNELKVVSIRNQSDLRELRESGPSAGPSRFLVCSLVAVLALATLLRLPYISSGLPFFYNEDEAHHFNRVVEMVKSGDLNPHYFHKPSLHFYLRIPIVAASFLSEVRRGGIRSIKEVKTRDDAGLAGYNFAASHPSIVKGNRAFSVLLSAATAGMVVLIAAYLTGNTLIGVIAGALFALSPDAIRESAVIGVDVPTTFFCVLTVLLALRLERESRFADLIVALCAGLAVSSKYNALPIIIVPLARVLSAGRFDGVRFATALIAPWIGFILGSPFIIAELPLFLDQLAYEIWHYGIAGHEGHTAEPGIAQAGFYLNWLATSAIGWSALGLAAVGSVCFVWRNSRVALVLITFPFIFFALMAMQRANFTRNMLPFLPFCAVLAAIGIDQIARAFPERIRTFLIALLAVTVTVQPAMGALAAYREPGLIVESRIGAMDWLRDHAQNGDTAVDPELEFPRSLYNSPGYVRLPRGPIDIDQLTLDGYSRVVSEHQLSSTTLTRSTLAMQLKGSTHDRILSNPPIFVYDLGSETATALAVRIAKLRALDRTLSLRDSGSSLICSNTFGAEDYCWSDSRQVLLELGKEIPPGSTLSLEIMTPWQGQTISMTLPTGARLLDSLAVTAGSWQRIDVHLPPANPGTSMVLLETAVVRSPKIAGNSEDDRRLGLAIKTISLSRAQ